ncbi:hypothetical protein K2224_15125 [Streptomyces sp. BHT-5-2]|uniref:hypothetical protein n=1 Tax=unclassified Streptomyces TaxID=2593676 RepID=UPI001C8EB822|nr:hypothetical protein [Streptomyces sp. BHT-5-2]QZL04345.1 hypothetical protein K2224_15125 [Streptomyces sp. BHT-5-2]
MDLPTTPGTDSQAIARTAPGILGTQDPQAHLFAVTLPNDGNTPLVLLGVTPETLPIRHGDRLRLKPLAGSAPGRRDPS